MELTVKLILLAVLVESLETLYRTKNYAKGGILSLFSVLPKKLNWLQTICFDKYFIHTVYAKLVLCVIGLIWLNPIIFGLIVVLQFIAFARHKIANSASDQIQMIILYGIFIYSLNVSPLVNQASIYFVAIQSLICYVTAGYHKLISPVWTKGEAVNLVLGTHTYGHVPSYQLIITKPYISKLLCWSTILLDFFFPFFVILFPEVAIVFFIFGFTFHLANAYLMGLNSFFYVFIASYPCIYLLSEKINSTLF